MTTPTTRTKRSQSGSFIDTMLVIPDARPLPPLPCGFLGYWRFTSRMAMQKAAAGISPPASLEKIQRHRVDFTSLAASSGTDRSATCGGHSANGTVNGRENSRKMPHPLSELVQAPALSWQSCLLYPLDERASPPISPHRCNRGHLRHSAHSGWGRSPL